MKFNKILLSLFFLCNLSFAQVEITVNDSDDIPTKKKITFTQFEISVPLQGNKNRGEVFPDGSTNDSWFVPDGINSNFGYGIHFNQWLGISANSGIGMKLSEKLVVAPVFTNLRIMPKVGDETRFGFDFGAHYLRLFVQLLRRCPGRCPQSPHERLSWSLVPWCCGLIDRRSQGGARRVHR